MASAFTGSLLLPPLSASQNSFVHKCPSLHVRRRLPSHRFYPHSLPSTTLNPSTTEKLFLRRPPIRCISGGESLSRVSSLLSKDAMSENDNDPNASWRRRNASLVQEAEANGVDSAVKMLWSLCQHGNAETQNFNQVVSLLAQNNRLEDGLALANEAAKKGLANIITYRPLMKWCCSNGDGRAAKRVWKAMNRWNIDGDMFLLAELMGALVRSRDMDSALRVISSIHESGRVPHIVLYNTLMKGYARESDVQNAFSVLRTIEKNGIEPDETTFNTLINACVRARKPEATMEAMKLMEKHNIKPGVPTFNTILKMYSRRGPFEKVLAVLNEMKQSVEPSIVTYNTLIDGCAHRGDMEQAAHFFEEMISKGMLPDICTMTSLLKGFGRSGDPQRAVELFDAMKAGGFKFEDRTRYAAINSCIRNNERTNARRILKEMKDSGVQIRVRTWIWLLECDVLHADEDGALETLSLMYGNGGLLDAASKATLLNEVREQANMTRLQRALKDARTDNNDQ